ncbi:Homeodomain-like domain-containing protein [Paenibacillus taihuensis]|uniref:Homeodomain-like domain-containing protein n=1 Tax=Paenibacillus taihuensis TaxID=1156355 RepID=A0A3D9RXL8_9BACL|nr:helix-turn-helix domain-containing protein [Paenibacillus taihuensis]REE84567.1 Homeodomain-like domain-containing protein [Paenibacillus taihuensis]
MDNNKASEKRNLLSEDEEIRRMTELREKGRADQIAQFEFLLEKQLEKQQLETAKKMLEKGYTSSEVSEILDVSEQTIQRWFESEMDSLAVIRSIASEGFRTGWKAGRKSSSQATIATNRAALMKKLPKNPNKRPSIAKNINFQVQEENEYWI